ncbi:MAG TPA: hypothetical protein VMV46_07410 [Thermoanaerobaculia bacterium]|nr:hypothetical protein [Thermoanaerobaculia bacterium]
MTPVKTKLSATIEAPLLEFLDSLPGATRSEKLERVIETYRRLVEEQELRRRLAEHHGRDEEDAEGEAWASTVAEAMWRD